GGLIPPCKENYVNAYLCSLVALLISDGGVSPQPKTSWTIYFGNNSDVLNSLFRNCMIILFGIVPSSQIRSNGYTFQRKRSKNIGESLLELTNSYRTLSCSKHPTCGKFRNRRQSCLKCDPIVSNGIHYPRIRFPKEIETDTNFAREFLKIVFSCDGGVALYTAKRNRQTWLIRKIFLDSEHPSVNSYYQKLLRILGFKAKIYGSQIRLQNREMIQRFKKEIGFIKGVQVGNDSKYWQGKTKNFVLNELLRSYKSSQ
ncbi:MAG: LAGLIDADG family homing endonuclease, partial [Candidatus Hermodarchaeota archaeon]|nr:LAGLIDADG family homing endonuclease [Candidatus Hermodarchaeota archaeon]